MAGNGLNIDVNVDSRSVAAKRVDTAECYETRPPKARPKRVPPTTAYGHGGRKPRWDHAGHDAIPPKLP